MTVPALPKFWTEMLFVPEGGAVVNVNVVPLTVKSVPGFCTTPDTDTINAYAVPGFSDRVKAVCDPVPLNTFRVGLNTMPTSTHAEVSAL